MIFGILKVNAYEIQQGCQISASGGATNAKLVIDFGYESLTSCEDGSEVSVLEDAVNVGMKVEILRWDWNTTVTISVGKLFTDIEVKGSLCDDTISILSTRNDTRSIEVHGGGGADSVVIGSMTDGLDQIEPTLSLFGGGSTFGNILRIDDAASSRAKDIILRSTFIQDMLDNANSTINFRGFDDVDIWLSDRPNIFRVVSTAVDSRTFIRAQNQSDTIIVNETQGYLEVGAGGGADEIFVYGLGEGTEAVVYGEDGDDYLFVDGRGDLNNTNATDPVNTLDGSRLRWSGGSGNDTLDHHFTSPGTSDVDVFEDNKGSNFVFVSCSDFDARILSRRTFLANLGGEDENAYLERLNVDIVTASITTLLVSLNGGENFVYFDDTVATMVRNRFSNCLGFFECRRV